MKNYTAYMIKLVLILGLTFGIVFGKIEDPVARHDSKECGTYLCSKIPTLATQYIQSGCIGEFTDFIKEQVKTVGFEHNQNSHTTNLMTYNTKTNDIEENCDISEINTPINILAVISALVLIFSTTIGYFFGKHEAITALQARIDQKEF